MDKSSEGEVENVPILSTSVAYGVYMAVSSNLRYEIPTTITLFKPRFAIIGLSLMPTFMLITHCQSFKHNMKSKSLLQLILFYFLGK